MLGAGGGQGRARVEAGCGGLGVVLRGPLHGRFIWPFNVAGLGDRYFLTVLAVRCGVSVRKPWLIDLMSSEMGGGCRDFGA
jgi:hypothetical protein